MTNNGELESILNVDWGDVWDSLQEAPKLVPRRKTAQITMRLPTELLARIRVVASAKGLAHHALARSWLVDGVEGRLSIMSSSEMPQAAQFNLKVDPALLDALKRRAHEMNSPYHALARGYLEAAVAEEEKALGVVRPRASRPAVSDLIVMLLHSTGRGGTDAIHGMTRLQKLLFVVEQKIAPSNSRFYAYDFGPFSEEVNDATEALRLAGFLSGGPSPSPAPPTFEEMMATAEHRTGPRDASGAEEFALNSRGHEAAERLRHSSKAYEQLFEYVGNVRQKWDTPDLDELVERVYASWPGFASKSLIKARVEERARKRRR